MNRAFSLVELSIVLVILGLLTGGILAGQSLIRAAELRSVVTEYQRYVTAVQTFRDKYMAIPGDMANATRFWGDNNSLCADGAIPNGSPGTCNGDGDGQLDGAAVASGTGEQFQFWNQLTLAGIIEGSYSGAAGSGSTTHSIAGNNIPASRLSNGGWNASSNWGTWAGDATMYGLDYQNHLMIGAVQPNTVYGNPILRPEEAWNIDTKLDDGRPAQGFVIARRWDQCTDSANQTDYTGNYLLTTTSAECALYFRNQFK